MWITLLVMAVAVSLEPFRIGMSVLMLNRPRPLLQLVRLPVRWVPDGADRGSGGVVPARIPSGIGTFHPATGADRDRRAGPVGGRECWRGHQGRPRTPPAWLSRLLDGQSLWVAGAAGLGIALPSVDYLAALAVIGTADISSTTRLAALLVFNVVAFALIEIPLLAYLVAPDRTRARLEALNDWVRARGRRGVAVLVAVVGTVLLVAGLAGL